MRPVASSRLRPAARGRRWLVLLVALLFALAGLAHSGNLGPAAAPHGAMAVASLLTDGTTALSGHGMDAPHLPGQPHDAKAGSCPFCGMLPAAIGPMPGPSFDGEPALLSSPAAAGPPPPLPPPRLRV